MKADTNQESKESKRRRIHRIILHPINHLVEKKRKEKGKRQSMVDVILIMPLHLAAH